MISAIQAHTIARVPKAKSTTATHASGTPGSASTADAWSVVRVQFRRALALRSEIRRAGWFNWQCATTTSASR
jgi:hypothetical protein